MFLMTTSAIIIALCGGSNRQEFFFLSTFFSSLKTMRLDKIFSKVQVNGNAFIDKCYALRCNICFCWVRFRPGARDSLGITDGV